MLLLFRRQVSERMLVAELLPLISSRITMRWWPYCPRGKHLFEPSSDTIYLNQDIEVFS